MHLARPTLAAHRLTRHAAAARLAAGGTTPRLIEQPSLLIKLLFTRTKYELLAALTTHQRFVFVHGFAGPPSLAVLADGRESRNRLNTLTRCSQNSQHNTSRETAPAGWCNTEQRIHYEWDECNRHRQIQVPPRFQPSRHLIQPSMRYNKRMCRLRSVS